MVNIQSITNTLVNLTRPSMVSQGLFKIYQKGLKIVSTDTKPMANEWAASNVESDEAFARALDSDLWNQATAYDAEATATADGKLRALADQGITLGGGGHHALLYFLVRYYQPQVAFETGVASGFSSRAILTAMHHNNGGHLWSSELPYFRLPNPERFSGHLVEPELRTRWTMLLKGDRKNVPEILGQVNRIDLFHYDSDKTYEARERVLRQAQGKFAPDVVIVFDDIQDNFHFRDYIAREGLADRARVFGHDGKYVGVVLPRA
ncbi:class I SAM-dependent methyltransferase [Methyloceanibacter methanicus]|nr:class I SAM-dependent methyltransferase [Methyloceanibacter methanicus]